MLDQLNTSSQTSNKPVFKPPVPRSLTFFVILFMSLCTIAALNQKNTEFLFYGFAMLIIIYILVKLHRRVYFSKSALWMVTIWGFLHMMGGTVPINPDLIQGEGAAVLYSFRLHPDLPRYDQFTHFFGFFGATVVCWEVVRVELRATAGITLSLIAVLMGMGLGALNEVLEFIATRFTDTNVGGYVNTGWDLVSNTIGTLAAGYWCLNRKIVHPQSGHTHPQPIDVEM